MDRTGTHRPEDTSSRARDSIRGHIVQGQINIAPGTLREHIDISVVKGQNKRKKNYTRYLKNMSHTVLPFYVVISDVIKL